MRLPAFALLLLLAAPAGAQSPDGQPPAPAAEKKICRTAEAKTGSFMRPKRECHTASEWAEIAKANRSVAPAVPPTGMQMSGVNGQN